MQNDKNKTEKNFFQKITNKIILFLQIALVLIFIIFEELIWENIAKPIYIFIHDLHILKSLERKLQTINRYIILGMFMLLLIGVESAGVMAGIMAVRGMVLAAILLYILKIPIAAFTFWLFRATESKLLSFQWFKWGYNKLLDLFAWIKSREIYIGTIHKAKDIKSNIKKAYRGFKRRYLSGENRLTERFKRLYYMLKNIIKKYGKTKQN